MLCRLLDPAGAAVRLSVARPGGATGVGRAPLGTQSYVDGSLVLQTVLRSADGEAEVLVEDALPFAGRGQSQIGRIVRLVTARRGPVEVTVGVEPGRPWARPSRRVSAFAEGIVADDLVVRTGHPFDVADRSCRVVLAPGERLVVTVAAVSGSAATDDDGGPISPDAAARVLADTTTAWRTWLGGAGMGFGPAVASGVTARSHHAAVERSLLVVGALTQHGTGGVVGAATTSLPARLGGERNEDHRWAWVGDASSAIAAFDAVGLIADAVVLRDGLRAIVLDGVVPLAAVADPAGGAAPDEVEIDNVTGYRRSQPVRSGPWSDGPRHGSLDHIVRLLSPATVADRGPWATAWPRLVALADDLADTWIEPDRGCWAVRGRPYRFVDSALAARRCLEAMAALARSRNPLDLDAVGWQQAARAALRWVEELAAATPRPGGSSRSAAAGASAYLPLGTGEGTAGLVDAALLQVAWEGPWPANHPLVAATVDRVLSTLGSGLFVHRLPPELDDGFAGAEGASLVASLWAVRALAALDRWEEAHERMEAVVGWAAPIGLLPSHLDPVSLEGLGDLPTAAAHLALIEASQALAAGPA